MSRPAVWSLGPRDGGYPGCLRDLGEAQPPDLFGVGSRSAVEALDHESTVTIVGSRSASSYGLRVAEALARDLAFAGVTIVSGMARGIDAAAHQGALAGGGTTIAVLANGPDVVYPARHRPLYDRMVGAGAALSEHPPGTIARKHFFPARNRLMAALGRVVILVEAAEPSGSLITADVASRLGRTVGAVPGQLGARNAEGVNALIKDGAQLIRDARDVLDLLFGVGHPGSAGGRRSALEPPLDIVFEQVCAGVCTVDGIVTAAGMHPRDVAVALSRLELCGMVGCDALGTYTPTGVNRF